MQKNVVYLHQFFFHPKEPGPTRAYWISRKLIEEGYNVTVISQKNPLNPVHKNVRSIERTSIDGINVIYIRISYSMEFSYMKRAWTFLKFMIKSTYVLLKQKNVDLLIASSTPLSIGFPALVNFYLKKTPFIFEVRDLWPEVPIKMGIIKNRIVIYLLRRFEKNIYKKAKHVVALSPGMAAGVTNHISPKIVSVIPNMSKVDKFYPRKKNIVLCKTLGLGTDTLKIIHFGAMGKVNGLDNFVNAASLASKRNDNNIEFVLVGGGKMKEEYRQRKSEEKINCLFIFDRLPMEELSELVNSCDVCYIGVSKFPILEHNSANKFFDSLSAGKPIIINFGGWMKDILIENKCGLVVEPEDAEDLLAKINILLSDMDLRCQMGSNARSIAIEKFDKSILTSKFADLVNMYINERD